MKYSFEGICFLKRKGKKIYTFPQPSKLRKFHSYSDHATFCSNSFYIFWAFKNLCNINLYLFTSLYLSKDELGFWNPLDVFGSWAWLRLVIKLHDSFWLETGQVFGSLLNTGWGLDSSYIKLMIVCVHQQHGGCGIRWFLTWVRTDFEGILRVFRFTDPLSTSSSGIRM